MKLDILAYAAHPDDAELGCGGTILREISNGNKVGIIDLTSGQLGTRGTSVTRKQEAKDASAILGLHARENLEMQDGFFEENKENLYKIIETIREYQPKIVLANAVSDRHPDHRRASSMVSRACFLSGLAKIKTTRNGVEQSRWRPEVIYHYVQFRNIEPDFVVDITGFMDKKMEAVKAYKTQFFNPSSDEPKTLISSERFFSYVESRAIEHGGAIEVAYGEGFTIERPVQINSLIDTLGVLK